MCRSTPNGGRRCPSHGNPGKIKERNDRRRELYEAGKLRDTVRPFLDSAGIKHQSGSVMETEYYVSKTGFSGKLVKPVKDLGGYSGPMKPAGGLWTSPARTNKDGTISSEWSDWNHTNYGASSANGQSASHVKALKNSVIVVIDSKEDAEKLFKAFPLKHDEEEDSTLSPEIAALFADQNRERISFEDMAKAGIDGLHLTENAINGSLNLSSDGYLAKFYGWDLPSTCWLNPVHLTGGKQVTTGGYSDTPNDDDDDYEIDWDSESFAGYSEEEVESLRKLLAG